MTEDGVYRRLLRRETHRSRTVAAALVSVAIVLVAAGVVVLWALPQAADARGAVAATLGLEEASRAIAAGAGIGAAVLGLLLVILAVSPGRRMRRPLASERCAVVVDDRVIADAIAARTARAATLRPERVRASVGRRRAEVVVTPTSGVPVDAEQAREAAAEESAAAGLPLAPRLRIAETGAIE